MPGKSFFAVHLPLKLFSATVANAFTGSLKSFHTLFDMRLDYMLAKFKPNHMVQNVENFELFDKKHEFFKTIFDKTLTPFCKTFLYLKLLFSDYHLLVFQKFW